ncbi:MAG: hypothetical protein ACYC1T_04250 [Sulfuricaulis sp.]
MAVCTNFTTLTFSLLRARLALLALSGMVLCSLAACDALGEQPGVRDYRTMAHFRVTDEVVNKDVIPFTATVPGIGNSLIDNNPGFEPILYRNKYTAQKNSPNTVFVSPAALSHYDTLREGVLDGADVYVYRIEGGRFNLVREDRIPKDGFHVSGWLPAISDHHVLPPDATSFIFRWDGWNSPQAKYYFTIRAIDRQGNLSAEAPTFEIERPKYTGKGEAPVSLVKFKPPIAVPASTPPAAPKNLRGRLRKDGTLLLEWDPVKLRSLAGYIVYRSDYPPEKHMGYHFQLEKTPVSARQHIRAGDMVFVSKKFYSASRRQFFSNRVWGAESAYNMLLPGLVGFFPDENFSKTWELVAHEPDTPVDEPGQTCLKLTLADGAKELIGAYNHSGVGQNWYPVLETRPYKVEIWMRQEGKGSVRFKFDGFYEKMPNRIAPIVFSVGPQWKRYVATFTPPIVQGSADPGRMGLEFTGPGTFYVDNLRVYRADAEYLDFLPRQYEDLKASGISALRTHGTIKTKFRTYDMVQLTNDGGAISGTAKSNSLPQLLRAVRKAGVHPWLQVEFHMHPQEWLAFVEYMAAPYDPARDTPTSKPWAYKRYSQGQSKPWVDEFNQILFELGNETWNGIFYPWIFDEMVDAASGKTYTRGQVYGMFQEYVISVMRSSPYWRPAKLDDKFVFVLGGWGGQSYGRDAASVSPLSRFLTISAYNGGWDEGEGPPRMDSASLFNVLSQVNQSAIPVADGHLKELGALNARRQHKLRLGTYEAGPGYVLNGLNNARITAQQSRDQEQVMKSLAAGTATLDSFLARAYRGFDIQNFFLFGNGALWASHAPLHLGGEAYPSWQLLSLFNNIASGDMLRTATLSVPTVNLKAFKRRRGIFNAPLTVVYATRKAGRYAVLVLSRKVPDYPTANDDGFTPVIIDLPFEHAKSLTLYRLTGRPEANIFLAGGNVKIEKIYLPPLLKGRRLFINTATGADERGLPPASTFLYVFDGVGTGNVK